MMEVFYFVENRDHLKYVTYVMDFLNDHPFVKGVAKFTYTPSSENTNLCYSQDKIAGSNGLLIPAQGLLFGKKMFSEIQWRINAYRNGTCDVYSVENQDVGDNFFEGTSFGFDWIETIFFHLSRAEEFHFPESQKNQWHAMPETELLLVSNGLHHLPVVDLLIKEMMKVLGLESKKLGFRAIITHDIDHIRRPDPLWKSFASHLRYYKYTKSILPSKYYDSEAFLIDNPDLERTIYVHLGGPHPFDGMEKMDKKANRILNQILDKAKYFGYKIGLHPSFNAAINADLFSSEKSKIEALVGREITQSRQHFLHFDFAKTVGILEHAGIVEDSSLGYNTLTGFRCGTAAPFYLYDFVNDRQSKVQERPMIWMDSGLLYEIGKSPENYHAQAEKFISELQDLPPICFNFHNHYMTDYNRYGINLKNILDMVVEKNHTS